MRKAILILSLLILCALAFGQGRTKHAGKAGKPAKPTAKLSPTPTPNKDGPFSTYCGVFYRNNAAYIEDLADKWVFIGETKADHIWHNPGKAKCDYTTRVLKVWIKKMHLNTDLQHALVLYELNCREDKLRVKSRVEYDKEKQVLTTLEYPVLAWEDTVPESIGESILKAACHR